MGIAVKAVDLHVLNLWTRMPFRYGIASLTRLPHVFMRAVVEVDGAARAGIAAEGLPPKWFTKDPTTSFREDLEDMRRVITAAGGLAKKITGARTVFDYWRELYAAQQRWAAGQTGQAEAVAPSRSGTGTPYPPLLWGLGPSLVERAVIDAFCRATGTTFARAVRANTLGIRLGDLHPELAGLEPAALLPAQPLRSIVVRHTVGLADPLTDAEIPAAERLADGLPQSLEACLRAYGLTHFKIKLYGDPARDTSRLEQIAALVARTGLREYAFTLDGNEQYHEVEPFRDFWQQFVGAPALEELMRHLLFVEQPLHRDAALGEAARRALRGWAGRPPVIVDESDDSIDSAARALAGGYAGTSHKNCKGVFRGIANACLVAHRQRRDPAGRYVLSGEDLATVGPVALLQDLAAMATLGIEHVERNGHHYFAGLSMLPPDVQAAVLAHHGDLYRRHAHGFPTLDVRAGRIAVGSVVDAPFGVGFALDPARLTPLAEWSADSLDAPPAAAQSPWPSPPPEPLTADR
jgi:hypothetical protein